MQTSVQSQRIRSIDRKFAWPSLKRISFRMSAPLVPPSVKRKEFDHPAHEQTIVSVREGERLMSQADSVAPTLCIDCGQPVTYGMLCADCRRVVERNSGHKRE